MSDVRNVAGVKLVRGQWRPVVNVSLNGRLIASEVMPHSTPVRADALKLAKEYCKRVDTIVRAALTPLTVVATPDEEPTP